MRRLKNLLLGLAAAAMAVLVQSRASASMIDTFDNNPAPALNLLIAAGDPAGTNTQPAVVGTISGNRKSTLTVLTGDEGASATMKIIGSLPNRRLSLSSEDSVKAQWELDYGPLGGIDITDGGVGYGIALHFLSADHTASVKVSLDVTGAGSPLTQTLPKAIGPGTLLFDFDAFINSLLVVTPVTPATAVNNIHITVLGDTSGDYSVEFIDTPHPTPEPTTWALAGIGLAGLTAWGWKRRRRQATAL